jgi:hypothetical protein
VHGEQFAPLNPGLQAQIPVLESHTPLPKQLSGQATATLVPQLAPPN